MSQEILNNKINNRLILKNTLYLYLRMFLIMAINLYTVRAILNILGVIDYGIYNAVGGVVAMFSFLNSTLTTSAQRYFSTFLVRSSIEKVRDWFSLNCVVTFFFAITILIVLETVGLWFLNTKMTIPDDRIVAANIVFQFSVFTVLLNVVKIPYDALIIAKERMKAFAIIGIIDAFLKLSVAFILFFVNFDRLIAYGALMMIVYAIIALVYIFYCIKNFQESKWKFYWNKHEIKELLIFSGWHFWGSISSVVRSHGINLLLNVFFSPVVNAARGIAYQINTAVSQFSVNFSTASRPQIYKSYAAGDYKGMNQLVMRSCILCFFLNSVIVLPLIINTDFVLEIWLKDVPEYSVLFTKLVLVTGLIECANTPLMTAALCTTNIKKYTIVVSFFTMLNLPISYIVLKMGGAPQSTMVVTAVLSLVALFVRAKLISENVPISVRQFYLIVLKVLFVNLISWIISSYFVVLFESRLIQLIVTSFVSIILISVLFSVFVISRSDIKVLLVIVKNKFNINA